MQYFNRSFLFAWSFLWFDVFFLILGYNFNLLEIILQDTSFITALIAGIYILANALCFALVYAENSNNLFLLHHLSRASWWLVSAFLALGMLGTVAGFYVMFDVLFANLDFSDIENTKQIVSQLTTGVSISLISTMAGIITSLLLSLKLVILNNANEV